MRISDWCSDCCSSVLPISASRPVSQLGAKGTGQQVAHRGIERGMVATGAHLFAQAGIIALERGQLLVVRADVFGTGNRGCLERCPQIALARGFGRSLGSQPFGLRGDHGLEPPVKLAFAPRDALPTRQAGEPFARIGPFGKTSLFPVKRLPFQTGSAASWEH